MSMTSNYEVMGGPGGWGGMGGGPLWLLLGLFFSRGFGFGGCGDFGRGGVTPATAAEFTTTLDAINTGRGDTLGALSSITATLSDARVENANSVAGIIQSVLTGNNDVKQTVVGAVSSLFTENRGMLGAVSEKLCGIVLQNCKDTNSIQADICASNQLTSAQFNCVNKELAALACGQSQLRMEIANSTKEIIGFITLENERNKAACMAAKIAELERAREVDSLKALVLSLVGGTTPASARIA